MRLPRLFKKDFVIGLDLGTTSIKMAQFLKSETGLRLVKTATEPIVGKDMGSAIKTLLKGIDIKKSKFIVAINCPDTAIKKLTAPYMPRQELREALLLGAKNYLTYPQDKAFFDFQIQGDVFEKGARRYKLITAISPKDTVNRFLSVLEKAGIRPAQVLPVSYALQKIAVYPALSDSALDDRKGGVNCFVDIGNSFTELLILKNNELAFSRKLPIAGNDFTKVMTDVLVSDIGKTELSFDEAEKIKKEVGLPSQSDNRVIDNKISARQLFSMLRSPLEQLANEIQRCFDYYREESGTTKIDSLVLFGAGASLKGLVDFLSKELEIDVQLGGKDDISHRTAVAAGAALSEADSMNLLPPEIKEQTRRAVRAATLKAAAAAVIVTSGLIWTGMKLQLDNLEKRLFVARLEKASLQPQVEDMLKQARLAGILGDEPYWEDVFKELSNVVPANICITELSMENKALRIKGIENASGQDKALSDFISGLEKGIFKNVQIISTRLIKERSHNEFELAAGLKQG